MAHVILVLVQLQDLASYYTILVKLVCTVPVVLIPNTSIQVSDLRIQVSVALSHSQDALSQSSLVMLMFELESLAIAKI